MLITSLLLSIAACKGVPNNEAFEKQYTVNGLSWEAGDPNPEIIDTQGDTTILLHGRDTLTLIKNSDDKIPESLAEAFRNQFYAVYYDRFFDRVLMDPKVKKIFRDSVTIQDVVIFEEPQNVPNCTNCNVVGKLLFKKKTFDLPVQMSQELLDEERNFNMVFKDSGAYKKKLISSKNGDAMSRIFIWNDNQRFLVKMQPEYPFAKKMFETVKPELPEI